jgi:hypothetical protein
MRSWAQDEHGVRGVGPLLSLGPRESSGLEAELETRPRGTRSSVNHFQCSLGVRREHPAWCRSQDPVSWLGDSVGMLSRTSRPRARHLRKPATHAGFRPPPGTRHRPVAVHHGAAAFATSSYCGSPVGTERRTSGQCSPGQRTSPLRRPPLREILGKACQPPVVPAFLSVAEHLRPGLRTKPGSQIPKTGPSRPFSRLQLLEVRPATCHRR